MAINTGSLAYTFTKLGDNLTNNDGDILNQIKSNVTLIWVVKSQPSNLLY